MSVLNHAVYVCVFVHVCVRTCVRTCVCVSPLHCSGQEKAVAKSKYEEDMYINNHLSVFGSYWEGGRWGYSCCHSVVKMSYCTGEQGKLAARVSLLTNGLWMCLFFAIPLKAT